MKQRRGDLEAASGARRAPGAEPELLVANEEPRLHSETRPSRRGPVAFGLGKASGFRLVLLKINQ